LVHGKKLVASFPPVVTHLEEIKFLPKKYCAEKFEIPALKKKIKTLRNINS